jgi:hypothetical protein
MKTTVKNNGVVAVREEREREKKREEAAALRLFLRFSFSFLFPPLLSRFLGQLFFDFFIFGFQSIRIHIQTNKNTERE